jgi:hypothetical protein
MIAHVAKPIHARIDGTTTYPFLRFLKASTA